MSWVYFYFPLSILISLALNQTGMLLYLISSPSLTKSTFTKNWSKRGPNDIKEPQNFFSTQRGTKPSVWLEWRFRLDGGKENAVCHLQKHLRRVHEGDIN